MRAEMHPPWPLKHVATLKTQGYQCTFVRKHAIRGHMLVQESALASTTLSNGARKIGESNTRQTARSLACCGLCCKVCAVWTCCCNPPLPLLHHTLTCMHAVAQGHAPCESMPQKEQVIHPNLPQIPCRWGAMLNL